MNIFQVAQLSKFREGGGLGISLEGTVDVEDGKEVRPHHYIRSILPDGPVGVNGKLQGGDELLEVSYLLIFFIRYCFALKNDTNFLLVIYVCCLSFKVNLLYNIFLFCYLFYFTYITSKTFTCK